MRDLTVSKSVYKLGRVYAILEKQADLTAEQALLLDELKSFRAKLIEIDYKLYGVFELGRLMEKSGKA
ncbi:MAG: hypothetical protein GX963_10525 [Bacteroidales bacterium]|nr:hypothetical protein [Bacteroidales bacterium]